MARAQDRKGIRLVRLTLLLAAISMSGCYFPDQRALEYRVQSKVAVAMPVQDAMAQLSQMRFDCVRANPADCSRLRESLMPYSCVERVRVYWSEQTRLVAKIEIPKIACAGL